MIRGLYDYHRWRIAGFRVATALGEELTSRDVGKQFSYSTIRRIVRPSLRGGSNLAVAVDGRLLDDDPGAEFATLASIRAPWTTSSESSEPHRRVVRGRPRPGHRVQGTLRASSSRPHWAAAPARGEPRHASSERDRDDADDGQRLAPDTGLATT